MDRYTINYPDTLTRPSWTYSPYSQVCAICFKFCNIFSLNQISLNFIISVSVTLKINFAIIAIQDKELGLLSLNEIQQLRTFEMVNKLYPFQN